MDIVYKKIINTFNSDEVKQRFTENNIPPIRTIDINIGQPENPEDFNIFYPAIFVDWSDKKNNENEPLELFLSFHIIQEPNIGSENFTNNIQQSLLYIETIKLIQQIFTGLSASNTSSFRYIGKTPNITPYYKYHILQYHCYIDEPIEKTTSETTLTDYSASSKISSKIAPKIDLDIETF